MLNLEERADLDRLIAQDIQESLTLDYKDSAALGKTSPQRNELCKDVSAFANSAGGQIIYGVQENGHHPARVQDIDAINSADLPREWIEQVIDSNVRPRIKDLHIRPIDVAPGRVAYVITIPQAMAHAPHMAADNKYYYRQNFQSVPMEDYQVRDAMRRATTPEPFIRLSFIAGMTASIDYAPETEISRPIIMEASIGNRSNQPAYYTLIKIGIDTDIQILSSGVFTPMGERTDSDGIPQNWLIHAKTAPPNMPVFREVEFLLTNSTLTLGYHSNMLWGEHRFRVTTIVQTPGFEATENWTIHQRGSSLQLLEPGHPLSF
jgi:Putative DNA-binding domain